MQGDSPARPAQVSAWAEVDAALTRLADCYAAAACDIPRTLFAAEACTEVGDHTDAPRLGLMRRAVIAGLERRFAIVADERQRYEEAGAIGPIYHRNSMQQQLQLMERIRALKEGAPMKRAISTLFVAVGGAIVLTLGACGGGGDQGEQPKPHPQVDCKAKPEACK